MTPFPLTFSPSMNAQRRQSFNMLAAAGAILQLIKKAVEQKE
jgi:hypothetical protein